ncbi:hypothetical protein CEP81_11880 [Kocuria rhizophila]|uniref:Uncharacterized protein n=1 Tax=Kocuria rhizophila (strain ATCC 9341 / DSM 348 / NBRC 103217 / DC2201) TaxID=378753 RepID=B2GLR4_KOCRD|nr:hypothetical protein CEP81_11880 [Kocuria rhizophila]BAG28598.1 hypothetical protein KRH_02510 [Kocuria rhizophila DC2201]
MNSPSTPTGENSAFIKPGVRVRGAREHNLKDIELTVPRDAMVGGFNGSLQQVFFEGFVGCGEL